MSTCYQCFATVGGAQDGIGVCQTCNSLACGSHGGLPGGFPGFACSRSVQGALTLSSGGQSPPGGGSGPGNQPPPSAPPSGPGGSGASPGGSGPGPATASGAGTAGRPILPRFVTSLDFERRLPGLAAASERERYEIHLDSLRESVRRLFQLLDDPEQREAVLTRARAELSSPVANQVDRQLYERRPMVDYWSLRGERDAAVEAELEAIMAQIRHGLEVELAPWLSSIYPVLDPDVWVGARDEVGGVIDLPLLADAVGLQAYNWNLPSHASPFARLDAVAAAPVPMLVLGELYGQALPQWA